MTEAQNPLTPAPVRLAERYTSNLPTPASVLAVGAHPDDVDFGAGATLAKWAADGCVVNILVCTDGSKGTWNGAADVAELVAIRQDEQRKAAIALGATGEVGFLGWPDGELQAGMTEREQLSWWIRKVRPSVVLGHDPWKRYRLHPDHRNAGLLVCDGVVAARDPLFFRDQPFAPHRPDALLLWEADEPDHVEEVDGWIDTKLAALSAHASQFESTMHATTDAELGLFKQGVEAKLEAAGAAASIGHAEIFKLIDDL